MKYTQGSMTGNIILWAIVIVVLGLVVFAMSRVDNTTQAPPTTEIVNEVSADDWVKGATSPQVTLIKYSDFQCPGCQSYSAILDAMVAKYPDDVQVVYRHFPLTRIHPNAIPAARAAEAAGNQNAFWEMHDKLFATQNDWGSQLNPEDTFVGFAEELGLDVDQFTTDYRSSEIRDAVQADADQAEELNLSSTPSVYFNGELITPLVGQSALEDRIEAIIN